MNKFNPFEELLLPYQKKVFLDKSRFRILNFSRQIGKGHTCGAICAYEAITNPRSLTVVISTGQRAAAEFLKKVVQWAEAVKVAAPDIPDLNFTYSYDKVEWANKSRVIALPGGNPASLRGWTGNVILDEAAMLENDKETWAACLPIITNQTSGKKWVILASTPSSLDTVFAEKWFDETGEWSKHRCTIYEAQAQGLKVDPEQLRAIVNDDFIFNVEYCCEFAASQDVVFPKDLIESNCNLIIRKPSKQYYCGYDVGRTNDRSVISIFDNNKQLVEIINLENTPYNEQLKIFSDLNKKYEFRAGYVDACGIGDMLAEEIQRTINWNVKPFKWSASNKTLLYDSLRKALKENEIFFSEEYKTMLVNDFLKIRRTIGKTGAISYTAPHTKTGHSDIVSSIVLANHAINEHALPVIQPFSYKRKSLF